MIKLILSLMLLLQGIPNPATENGRILGTLRDSAGMPLRGIRIAAMSQPDSPQETVIAAALVSLAETDDAGRYVLESVPPGRYYITAGRVDFPTYYPGTQDVSAGKVVLVTSGAIVSGMDFVMKDTSVRPAVSLAATLPPVSDLMIPVSVNVENGGRLPVFSPRGYPMITVTRVADGLQSKWPLNSTRLSVGGYPAEYRVAIENLPEGYAAKSLLYGSTNLAVDAMKILAANSPVAWAAVPTQTLTATTIFGVATAGASWAAATVITNTGVTLTPPSPLSIMLTTNAPTTSPTGVRVSGSAKGISPRWIYLSDKPGTLFSDGSFEFRGVPPGRHAIVTLDNPNGTNPFAAFVVVGDRDLAGVELEQTPVLPYDVRSPAVATVASGNMTPGAIPIASLRGRLTKDRGQDPVPGGNVFVVGLSWASVPIDADGSFEFARLLPGKYDLEIQAVGYPTVRRSLVVATEDINLDLSEAFTER